MADKNRMDLLAGLARERSDAAARRLAHSLAALQESRSRLELLERYRDEYQRRLSSSSCSGIAANELRNFGEFLARLGSAIAQQRDEVQRLADGVNEVRDRWLAERTREKSFGVLAERAADAARAVEARRLQKMLDESSGRFMLTRSTG